MAMQENRENIGKKNPIKTAPPVSGEAHLIHSALTADWVHVDSQWNLSGLDPQRRRRKRRDQGSSADTQSVPGEAPQSEQRTSTPATST